MELIDGKKIAEEIKAEIKREVQEMVSNKIRVPHLAAVLVGDDPASQTYVASKEKACHEAGIVSSIYRYSKGISEKELLQAVGFLNQDTEIDGFIVQLPLPPQINVQKITEAIDPSKDVDGFHPVNVGKMLLGIPSYLPATPAGIIMMLEKCKIETEGKNCVVLGRSNIVGSPMAVLMSRNANPGNATVTICHSKTKNLKAITSQADILIVAIGKPEFVTADMVKDGAVVIDVGIHRIADPETNSGFRLKGDVKFDEVSPKCSFITPVPGGVGIMTIVSLLKNTLLSAKKTFYP